MEETLGENLFNSIAILIPAFPDAIIVLTDDGIFRSTDDGTSFSKVYSNSYIQTITRTSLGWIGYDKRNEKFLALTDRGATWVTPDGSNWATVADGAGLTNKK